MPYSRPPWTRRDGTVTAPSVGTVCHLDKTNPNRVADGRLIVAAPIMLETLQAVRVVLEGHELSTAVDAAIVKALGLGTKS